MDPDAALRAIRQHLADYREAEERGDPDAVNSALLALASVTEAMDEWMSEQGHPPAEWRRVRSLTYEEGDKVARATFEASREVMRGPWHHQTPQNKQHWSGVAAVAISEYLRVLSYDLVMVDPCSRPTG